MMTLRVCWRENNTAALNRLGYIWSAEGLLVSGPRVNPDIIWECGHHHRHANVACKCARKTLARLVRAGWAEGLGQFEPLKEVR